MNMPRQVQSLGELHTELLNLKFLRSSYGATALHPKRKPVMSNPAVADITPRTALKDILRAFAMAQKNEAEKLTVAKAADGFIARCEERLASYVDLDQRIGANQQAVLAAYAAAGAGPAPGIDPPEPLVELQRKRVLARENIAAAQETRTALQAKAIAATADRQRVEAQRNNIVQVIMQMEAQAAVEQVRAADAECVKARDVLGGLMAFHLPGADGKMRAFQPTQDAQTLYQNWPGSTQKPIGASPFEHTGPWASLFQRLCTDHEARWELDAADPQQTPAPEPQPHDADHAWARGIMAKLGNR